LVNRVKHEHGQIRCVAFSDGSLQSAGYYLEGLDAQGVAMPDPSVHPGNTAFSFNRDLRYHFIQLFEIGSALKGALTSALRAQKLRAVESTYKSTSEEFTSIAERVSNLPQVVLPDEPAKPTPSVLARRDADDVVLSVTYPSLTKLVSPATIRFTTFISLDGGPLSYRVPYFSEDKNER
jgi:hypothetical protein